MQRLEEKTSRHSLTWRKRAASHNRVQLLAVKSRVQLTHLWLQAPAHRPLLRLPHSSHFLGHFALGWPKSQRQKLAASYASLPNFACKSHLHTKVSDVRGRTGRQVYLYLQL